MYYNTKASGARIRELRIAKNFTQDNLAEHMNVSRGFISLIESGKKGCSVDVLIALSNLFGVFIDAFHALFCGGNKLGRSHNQSAALIKAHRAVFPRGGKRNDL